MTYSGIWESAMDEEKTLMACLRNRGLVDMSDLQDDTIATLATDYAVAALCWSFCVLFWMFRWCCNPGVVAPGSGPTETTPLQQQSSPSWTPFIRLTRRTPYKETLSLFFLLHGIAFGLGAVRHQFETRYDELLRLSTTATMAFSISLLLGLAGLEYWIHVRQVRVIKAPSTYLWILIVIGSTVGFTWLDRQQQKGRTWLAVYFFVVVLWYLTVSISVFRRCGRLSYHFLQVLGMLFYVMALVVAAVFTQLCAADMGVEEDNKESCIKTCPLPIDVFPPEALFHVIVIAAIFFFGWAKVGQIRYESKARASPSITV